MTFTRVKLSHPHREQWALWIQLSTQASKLMDFYIEAVVTIGRDHPIHVSLTFRMLTFSIPIVVI